MKTKLERVAERASQRPRQRFNNLAHILDDYFMNETWLLLNRRAASGVDRETAEDYAEKFTERVMDLLDRVKGGRYLAPPVRRVYIEKPGKPGAMRPIGIPTTEDKLLQRAVVRILEAIYEKDFLDFSYGFRPGRNQHMALNALWKSICLGKTSYVFEADIKGYFDHINHDWMQKMLDLRVCDPIIRRLITKWLKAGVMENGVVVLNQTGTPQGGSISPLLSNIYLHYALDLWFEKEFKPMCKGEANLVRFADDFVVCFQFRKEARMFSEMLHKRMAKFGLELAPDKTRLISFGRYAEKDAAEVGKRPETFDFLGFTHVCETTRHGKYMVARIPTKKSLGKFRARVHQWLRTNMHKSPRLQQRKLTEMLNGYYQYFSIYGSLPKLKLILDEVERMWWWVLNRRSQRSRLTWAELRTKTWFKLPAPPAKLLHPAG